ncbi:MAG TPA: SDR family NAD(P)-dependent oxidoreductase [Candidatus Limnocylindrales bacterium]|nr:SDR family NAD(P)-dependent oxidoreductase [Candidatus Limnocylindrales bacterium]
MKVLITGGAGFIGQRTALLLLEQGHQVSVLDNLSPPAHSQPPSLPAGIEVIQGDVRKREDWVRAVADAEVVIHLADHRDYLPSYSKLFAINAVGTALLLELLAEGNTAVKRLVLGSTVAVYGEGKYRCPQDGDVYPEPRSAQSLERGVWDPPCPRCGGAVTPMVTDEGHVQPSSVYGLSKLAQEDLVRLTAQRHGFDWVVLRYAVVQGGTQPFQNAYDGALRIFALRLALDRPLELLEDGNQLRDFVHVADAARATLVAAQGLPVGVYNVGSGKAHTVLDLARTLIRAADRSVTPEVPGRYRIGDPRHVIPDIGRIRAGGWEPQISLEAMAREYLQWLERQPNLDAYFEGADYLMERTGTVRFTR